MTKNSILSSQPANFNDRLWVSRSSHRRIVDVGSGAGGESRLGWLPPISVMNRQPDRRLCGVVHSTRCFFRGMFRKSPAQFDLAILKAEPRCSFSTMTHSCWSWSYQKPSGEACRERRSARYGPRRLRAGSWTARRADGREIGERLVGVIGHSIGETELSSAGQPRDHQARRGSVPIRRGGSSDGQSSSLESPRPSRRVPARRPLTPL